MLLLLLIAAQVAKQKMVVDHGIVPVVVVGAGHIDGIDKISIVIVKNLDLKLKI